MNVQVKSSNGISLVHVDTRLLADRKIFIEGEINEETACEFMKKVMYLNSENREKNIDLLINSPGGEINAGMLMSSSLVATVTKRRIVNKYKSLFIERGYDVQDLDFVNPQRGDIGYDSVS